MERSIFSSRNCFLENLKEHDMITKSGYEVIKEWFDFMTSSPQINLDVDLIVYIKTDPEVAWSRLKQWGRSEEEAISKQYIEDLHQLHEDWLIKGNKVRPASVMVINANRDLEEMNDIFSEHAKMIVEDARREKGTNQMWSYQTPFQPEIISN